MSGIVQKIFTVFYMMLLAFFLVYCRSSAVGVENGGKNEENTAAIKDIESTFKLDLKNIDGNLRFLAISAQNSGASPLVISSLSLSQEPETPRYIINTPTNIDLAKLQNNQSLILGDKNILTGTYYEMRLMAYYAGLAQLTDVKANPLANKGAVIPMPPWTVANDSQYVIVLALDPTLKNHFVRLIAQVKDGQIIKVIFEDPDGSLARTLPQDPFGEPEMEILANCGNGKRHSSEECDDGNLNDEDGCSSLCKIEDGYPLCRWACDDPVCPATCTPICEAPNCQANCQAPTNPPNCTCEASCQAPNCQSHCQQDACEMDVCPQCEIACEAPDCEVSCQKIDPEGADCVAPAPVCETNCQQINCAWNCSQPQCNKPHCELSCKDPPQCRL